MVRPGGSLAPGYYTASASHTRQSIYIFFFQAEDGIRDWSVTGVQTCALPIYHRSVSPQSRPRRALQEFNGERRSGDRISPATGERASISRQRLVARGCQHRHLSAAPLQEFDGLLRLHRWPAPLRLSRRTIGETFAQQE